jgi:rhodanese-related sulfurtransferase
MKSAVLALGLALALTLACSKNESSSKVKEVSITELKAMLATNSGTPVDANGPETRKNRGVIPGAIRLSDYETFSASELPADKARPLVFYCANEQCGASHTAAAKALATGHTNVKVLPAGIKGWVDAGMLVEPGA